MRMILILLGMAAAIGAAVLIAPSLIAEGRNSYSSSSHSAQPSEERIRRNQENKKAWERNKGWCPEMGWDERKLPPRCEKIMEDARRKGPPTGMR